jgi:hypothetical protein
MQKVNERIALIPTPGRRRIAMPVNVSRLPDEPIVVVAYQAPINIREDIPAMFRGLNSVIIDAAGEEVLYVISDTTNAEPLRFGDMVFVLSEARMMTKVRSEQQAVQLILVGSDSFMNVAAKAMSQPQHGGFRIQVFGTLDEALTTARLELAITEMQSEFAA